MHRQTIKKRARTSGRSWFRYRFVIITFLLLIAVGGTSGSSSAQTYSNPVVAGDFPDPSVIRVGDDYYASATSGNWSPFYPIAHSRDLINWKILGSVFAKMPAWAKGDFWAPELAYDSGKFYVFYTARRNDGKGKKGTLCVAVAEAEKATGPYTDHGPLVCQEMGSLDAFFIRDEGGKPFLVWKEDGNDRQQPTWLYSQQLDTSLTKLIGKPHKLFRNEGAGWENHVIEGADIVRRGDWFYMFYSGNACCGRTCNYALGVARSKSLLGKWEKNPGNPILAANEYWQCPGHGTIVTTPRGDDFLLYHAYRRNSEAFSIGREALLDRVEWPKEGWATINEGKGPSVAANAIFTTGRQVRIKEFVDEFEDSDLHPSYQMPNGPVEFLVLNEGTLSFAGSGDSEAVIGIRPLSVNYEAFVTIKNVDVNSDERSGLSAYSWRDNAVGISVSRGRVASWRRERGRDKEMAISELKGAGTVKLRMAVKDAERFQFAYSVDGKVWMHLGKPVTGSQIDGARVALMHSGRGRSARFDSFRVRLY